MYMPVAPAYGAGNGGGFGDGMFGFGGGWWIIIFLIVLMGWGNNGWGNNGGNAGGYFPWIMAGQQTGYSDVQRGFDQSAVITGINGVHDAVTAGFAGVQQSLCSGFAGVQNGFAQAEIANNARQIADMQQNFAMQTALQQCCCDNKAGLADVKYTIATEGCNTRATSTANTQAILDKLCQLELDGVKSQLADANNTINQLRTQLIVSNNEASQTAQTAAILAGQGAEVDALYNRLNSCPVPTTPVYGRTPIFTCGNNGFAGCGCGAA
jgi:hypothetical protein